MSTNTPVEATVDHRAPLIKPAARHFALQQERRPAARHAGRGPRPDRHFPADRHLRAAHRPLRLLPALRRRRQLSRAAGTRRQAPAGHHRRRLRRLFPGCLGIPDRRPRHRRGRGACPSSSASSWAWSAATSAAGWTGSSWSSRTPSTPFRRCSWPSSWPSSSAAGSRACSAASSRRPSPSPWCSSRSTSASSGPRPSGSRRNPSSNRPRWWVPPTSAS